MDAGFDLIVAAIYLYIGALMAKRPVSYAPGRRAMQMFALWWAGLAVTTGLGAIPSILAAVGVLSVPLHAFFTYASIVPLSIALWGLVYYLAYIYTGNERLFLPIAAFHVALLIGLLALIAWLQPAGVIAQAWQPVLVYTRPTEGLGWTLALSAVLGPALFAAIAYGTLIFRAENRTARYRVAMVSSAFVLWFGVAAAAQALGYASLEWWPIASRVTSLIATALVLLAFQPPRFLQELLHVDAIERPAPAGHPGSLALGGGRLGGAFRAPPGCPRLPMSSQFSNAG